MGNKINIAGVSRREKKILLCPLDSVVPLHLSLQYHLLGHHGHLMHGTWRPLHSVSTKKVGYSDEIVEKEAAWPLMVIEVHPCAQN